jgi:hypothetical protein
MSFDVGPRPARCSWVLAETTPAVFLIRMVGKNLD